MARHHVQLYADDALGIHLDDNLGRLGQTSRPKRDDIQSNKSLNPTAGDQTQPEFQNLTPVNNPIFDCLINSQPGRVKLRKGLALGDCVFVEVQSPWFANRRQMVTIFSTLHLRIRSSTL